jgi:hypothetical protein
MELSVGCPGKDEHANGDEPTGKHHRYETRFCRRAAIVLLRDLEVMIVDKGRTCRRQEHTNNKRNEHEPGYTSTIALHIWSAWPKYCIELRSMYLALLIDDWKCDEEHIQEPVKDAHI